ncbi:MAG: helix-turn-helix domain-containing protein [Candidatus Absconditabacteria bacterium]
MDASLLITLQNYGFSEKEAKVYLTALELGSSPASTIARRSEIKRVTVYTILEDLKKKGVSSDTNKGDVKYYSVISPDTLLRQLEQKYESFKAKVPELLALADTFGNKPKIQFFEGFEGMKKMYDDQLSSKTDLKAFMGRHELNEKLSEYLMHIFIPNRVKNKVLAKVILSNSPENKSYHKKSDKLLLKESILIEDTIFNIPDELLIYDNKVAIALYTDHDMCGIIIHSDKFFLTMQSIFDLIWKMHTYAKQQ